MPGGTTFSFIISLGWMLPTLSSSPFPKPSRFPADDVEPTWKASIVLMLYPSCSECCISFMNSVGGVLW